MFCNRNQAISENEYKLRKENASISRLLRKEKKKTILFGSRDEEEHVSFLNNACECLHDKVCISRRIFHL